MTKIVELYGVATTSTGDWSRIVKDQHCPFLQRKCLKIRKSEPNITIGSCTIAAGRDATKVMICPFRMLERRQVFIDCLHLLTLHEPGNELHVVSELDVPGGSIDYCLVSVRNGAVVDFAGIELQTLDTTGTVWPERERFLHLHGLRSKGTSRSSKKSFGLNWKMTAKTTLVQLHHKVSTFEHVGKHLVLVLQRELLSYMKRGFAFDHLTSARLGDPMHFHAYTFEDVVPNALRLRLHERLSTNATGIATCLGLRGEANLELDDMLTQLQTRITPETLLALEQPALAPNLIGKAAEAE